MGKQPQCESRKLLGHRFIPFEQTEVKGISKVTITPIAKITLIVMRERAKAAKSNKGYNVRVKGSTQSTFRNFEMLAGGEKNKSTPSKLQEAFSYQNYKC